MSQNDGIKHADDLVKHLLFALVQMCAMASFHFSLDSIILFISCFLVVLVLTITIAGTLYTLVSLAVDVATLVCLNLCFYQLLLKLINFVTILYL